MYTVVLLKLDIEKRGWEWHQYAPPIKKCIPLEIKSLRNSELSWPKRMERV